MKTEKKIGKPGNLRKNLGETLQNEIEGQMGVLAARPSRLT